MLIIIYQLDKITNVLNISEWKITLRQMKNEIGKD